MLSHVLDLIVGMFRQDEMLVYHPSGTIKVGTMIEQEHAGLLSLQLGQRDDQVVNATSGLGLNVARRAVLLLARVCSGQYDVNHGQYALQVYRGHGERGVVLMLLVILDVIFGLVDMSECSVAQ